MLVAGVDSSTQGCKVVIVDVETGNTVRQGRASHPAGTECPPEAWVTALDEAIASAGGIEDIEAISVAGQQHGMVLLDAEGEVVRPALLWNDTRSAPSADVLIAEIGREQFAKRTGVVPVASFTGSKLRWMRDNEPGNVEKTAAVCLPHDYLTWRLRGYGPLRLGCPGGPDLDALVTDRSDASGTAYWGPHGYDGELFELAFGRGLREAGSKGSESAVVVPRVLGPSEGVPSVHGKFLVGAGAGDNAGGALGLNITPGDVVVSIGTSGAVFAPSEAEVFDPSGTVAGFCDASGRQLPLICTLNGARVLQSATAALGCTYDELSDLALSAEPGSGGMVLVPYFEGERTPNLPTAEARLVGMTLANTTRVNMARAFVEGMLCSLAHGLKAVETMGVDARRLVIIGGAAANRAVQICATRIFAVPIVIPVLGEYVARGAAVQAAWAFTGAHPDWRVPLEAELESQFDPVIFERYLSAAVETAAVYQSPT